jgi:hypothetical protein
MGRELRLAGAIKSLRAEEVSIVTTFTAVYGERASACRSNQAIAGRRVNDCCQKKAEFVEFIVLVLTSERAYGD